MASPFGIMSLTKIPIHQKGAIAHEHNTLFTSIHSIPIETNLLAYSLYLHIYSSQAVGF